jgi:iron complex outermembrane recepter protein
MIYPSLKQWIPMPGWLALFAGIGGCAPSEPLPETPPRQISESPFHYPEELWDQGIQGQTMLRVFVTDAGQVDSVTVDQTSGHAAFDSATVQGAHRLRFEPARRGEEPVGVWVLLPVEFDMTNAAAEGQQQP